jgi:hypothetical protein
MTDRDDAPPKTLGSRFGVPYEAQVFGRLSLFGLVFGAGYWFLTYETAGSVLLFTFGIASGIATVAITVGAWTAGRRPGAKAATATLAPDDEPIPNPGWTPLLLSLGLGLVALGLILGPWLLVPGVLVVLTAAVSWLRTVVREADEARGIRRVEPGG